VVLRVEGEIDVLTAPRLTARLERIMRRHRGDVVLDLTNTEFIDSAGLGVLLSARRRLDRASRQMSVLCEGSVRRVIEQARLIDTLGVAPESSEHKSAAEPRAAIGDT
jgi:anti-sigma B factor antagonist